MKQAFFEAAGSPATWAPLAGAGLLVATGADEELTEWAIENQPLWGDDPDSVSDRLLATSSALYYLTALIAPSASAGDKAKGLAVGVGSRLTASGLTEVLKSLTGRERPNGFSDNSFPSGHAAMASANAVLVSRNVEYIDMPGWAANSMKAGMWTIAGVTSWARVEAGSHYVSDVLVGLALGNFVTAFLQDAFLGPAPRQMNLGFTAVEQGGVLTLSIPFDP